jgi:hypothetical protein
MFDARSAGAKRDRDHLTVSETERVLTSEFDTIADMLVVDVYRKMAFDLIDAKRDTPVVASHLRRVPGAVRGRALDAQL